MTQRTHRIEQMGEHSRARRDTGRSFLECRVGMSDRHHHPARGQPSDRLEGARQFRRKRDELQILHRYHALEYFAARLEVELRMRTETRGRDERSLEMHPKNPR